MKLEDAPRIAVICGPTASGKTAFSLALAERVGAEIVVADSLQVYRHLDIGTAKPTLEERQRIPHHLCDILDPDEPFNAALFKKLADEAIARIGGAGKIPLVVGGTGLYLRILERGVFEAPAPDPELRRQLDRELNERGLEALYQRLARVDPAWAARVEPRDRTRILRGLEVFEQTGVPMSEHQTAHDGGRPRYRAFKIGIKVERTELASRIEQRTAEMLERGLLEEVRRLRRMGYDGELKPLMSLGYRQMGELEGGLCTWDAARDTIVRQTRQYAKRQLTWFRKDEAVHWVESPGARLEEIAQDLLRFFRGETPQLQWQTSAR